MKKILIIFVIASFTSCKKKAEIQYVYPKAYLPAYPGSYWDYTNGERVLTSKNYVQHQYEESINSNQKTPKQYVPQYMGQYLYEYGITQNSTTYPLKKLLNEELGQTWEVNKINNQKIIRKVVEKKNEMKIPFPPFNKPIDSLIKDILVVIEYIDTLGEERWNTREYYAKDIGLIRVDVNNPFDESPPVVQKQIQGYHINK